MKESKAHLEAFKTNGEEKISKDVIVKWIDTARNTITNNNKKGRLTTLFWFR